VCEKGERRRAEGTGRRAQGRYRRVNQQKTPLLGGVRGGLN